MCNVNEYGGNHGRELSSIGVEVGNEFFWSIFFPNIIIIIGYHDPGQINWEKQIQSFIQLSV